MNDVLSIPDDMRQRRGEVTASGAYFDFAENDYKYLMKAHEGDVGEYVSRLNNVNDLLGDCK